MARNPRLASAGRRKRPKGATEAPEAPFTRNYDLFAMTLAAAVPLIILELRRRGGPDEHEWEWARRFSETTLTESADVMVAGGGKPGEAALCFNGVARCVAILAFVPGGITLCGRHWQA